MRHTRSNEPETTLAKSEFANSIRAIIVEIGINALVLAGLWYVLFWHVGEWLVRKLSRYWIPRARFQGKKIGRRHQDRPDLTYRGIWK